MISVPTNCKRNRGNFFKELLTSDSQLRKRNVEGFCDKPYPYLHLTPSNKVTALTENHWRELWKIVIRMLRFSSPQLFTSGRSMGVEGLSFFKRLAPKSLTMFHWLYGQMKLNFFSYSYSFVGGRIHQGQKADLG